MEYIKCQFLLFIFEITDFGGKKLYTLVRESMEKNFAILLNHILLF